MASLLDAPAPEPKKKLLLTDAPAPQPATSLLDAPAPADIGEPGYRSPFADYVPYFTGEKTPTGLFPGQVLPRDTSNPELNRSAIASDIATLQQPIKTAGGGVQSAINVASTPLSVAHAFQNQIAIEQAKVERRLGPAKGLEVMSPADSMQIIRNAIKNTDWSGVAKGGLSGKEFVPYNLTSIAAQQGPPGNIYSQSKVNPAILDFVLSFGADAAVGQAQNKVVSALEPHIAKLSQVLVEKVPALQNAVENNKAFKQAQGIMTNSAARQEPFLRAAADTAEDVRKTSQKYMKAGAPIRGHNPATGQVMNVFDALVADYMDAGNPGSKFEHIHPPAPPTPQELQAAENVYSTMKGAKGAVPKIIARLNEEQQAAKVAEQAGRAEKFVASQQALSSAEMAQREKIIQQTQAAIGKQKAKAATKARQQAVLAEAVQGGATRGKAAAGAAAQQGRAAAQAAANEAAMTAEADRLALQQFNETTDAIRNSTMPPGEVEAMIGRMKDAARNVVNEARVKGEQLAEHEASVAAAQKAEREAAAATRKAEAERIRLEKAASREDLRNKSAAEKLMAGEQARRARQLEVATRRGAADAAVQARRAEREAAAAARQAVAQSAEQAKAAAKQTAEQTIAQWTERARGAMPKIESDQAAAMQARAERRSAELEHIGKVAKAYGVDMKDVQRIGDKYSNMLDTLGQELVDNGLLDPNAYAELKGQYLPRLYLLTKGDPGNVNAYLDFLQANGAISPENLIAARAKLMTKGFAKGQGPQQFRKHRELTGFEERSAPEFARAMIPEATPAALHGIGSQARAVGEAEGHAAIAANPNLAVPIEAATPEQAASWVPFKGKGPLEGHVLQPGVANYLSLKNSDYSIARLLEQNGQQKAANAYRTVSKTMKAAWISSPKTAVNNAVGNYELGSSAAAINGANYSLPGYMKALGEIRAFRKGGNAAPYLQEALDHTDILTEGSQLIPKAAKQVRGGFGVETAAQKIKGLPAKGYELYTQNAYQDVEKAGRYYLYKELRQAGKSEQEAAKIVNAAMITYSDIGPLRRALEQNPIFGAPFITFPTKAVFQYLNTALRRPDKFSTYTGQRWSAFLDQLAGPEAVKRRAAGPEAGGVGPTDFPVNGKYYRIPQLAPVMQSLGTGPGADISSFGIDRLASAFPGPNLVRGLAMNQKDIGGGKTVPIVPPGSIPGVMGGPADVVRSPEVAGAYGLQLGKSLLPEVGDMARIVKAIQKQPDYDNPNSPVGSVADAVVRALTGATGGENIGRNKLEQSLAGAARMRQEANPDLARMAFSRLHELQRAYHQDKANYTPNADYQRVADSVPVGQIKDAMQNAINSLGLYVSRKKGSEADRSQRVKDLLDWIFTLSVSQARRTKAQGEFIPAETKQQFGSLLAP